MLCKTFLFYFQYTTNTSSIWCLTRKAKCYIFDIFRNISNFSTIILFVLTCVIGKQAKMMKITHNKNAHSTETCHFYTHLFYHCRANHSTTLIRLLSLRYGRLYCELFMYVYLFIFIMLKQTEALVLKIPGHRRFQGILKVNVKF